ncbi:hypothetical protein [Mesorhizobium sp.]|uniref:hypothetical protein n=1 Tax=Mesorhizobium sp. TaxID=1871066 RepID=UPI000FE4849D|nr:hypothetical protein [Mesorhizobium sp.]RWB67563.1 MAG: hypothetical protein EOQ49_24910 [Mesorhizobium sp.]
MDSGNAQDGGPAHFHTPGPWKAGLSAGRKVLSVSAANDTWICGELLNGDDMPAKEAEANARLIAAAPEMLAALQSIATKARELASDRMMPNGGLWAACAEEAEAAVARAVAP